MNPPHLHQTSLSLSLLHALAQNENGAVRKKQSGVVGPLATARLRLIAYLHYNWVCNQTINQTQRSVFITSEHPFISAYGQ